MSKYLVDFLGELGVKSSPRRRAKVISKIFHRVRMGFPL
jgi:hypothetical protein